MEVIIETQKRRIKRDTIASISFNNISINIGYLSGFHEVYFLKDIKYFSITKSKI